MKAIFNTKFTSDEDRNGQEVEILSTIEDCTGKRYTIRFSDGYVIEHAYSTELDFGY